MHVKDEKFQKKERQLRRAAFTVTGVGVFFILLIIIFFSLRILEWILMPLAYLVALSWLAQLVLLCVFFAHRDESRFPR